MNSIVKNFDYEDIDDEHRIVNLKLCNDTNLSIMFNHRRKTFNANYIVNQFTDNDKTIKQWKRTKEIVEYIDYISMHMNNEHHYIYKGNNIYKEDGNLKDELCDKRGRVLKSLLSERNDDIEYVIEAGRTNRLKGTWFTYEILPEILHMLPMNLHIYVINHYNILLRYLTNDEIREECNVNSNTNIKHLIHTLQDELNEQHMKITDMISDICKNLV